jgi:hypothetical protein
VCGCKQLSAASAALCNACCLRWWCMRHMRVITMQVMVHKLPLMFVVWRGAFES